MKHYVAPIVETITSKNVGTITLASIAINDTAASGVVHGSVTGQPIALQRGFPMSNEEKLVLAHRYLYYVLAQPVLPDAEYDKIERRAREILPEDNIVHRVGSSLPSSYSEEVKQYADKLLHG